MFYQLHEFGVIQVSGKDAQKLLQGQISCNVETLTHQQGSMAVHCEPNGRIISLFYLFFYRESYYLLLPESMITLCLSALKKYAIFYKVMLTNVSEQYCGLGYVAPELDQSIRSLIMAYYSLQSSQNRYLILCTQLQAKAWHPQTVSSNIWDQWDVADCIPRIYPATSKKILPHDIELPKFGALSFDKGCYTGQEIIARMHYKAKMKKKLTPFYLESDQPMQVGEELALSLPNQDSIDGIILMAVPTDLNKQKWALLLQTRI